jgi:hypothetical protein
MVALGAFAKRLVVRAKESDDASAGGDAIVSCVILVLGWAGEVATPSEGLGGG